MNIKLTVLLFGIIYINYSTSVILECKFADEHYTQLNYVYSCLPINLKIDILFQRTVTFVTGDRTRKDPIKALWAQSPKVNYFPRNLKKMFPEIIGVGFDDTGIYEIQQMDLKPFGDQLEYFRLSGSKIETIPSNLFEYNPNLKVIGLQYNQIQYVGHGAFEELSKLSSFWTTNNKCITDGDISFNRFATIQLYTKIQENCYESEKDEVEALRKEIKDLKAKCTVS